jgi:hypothetical protein
VLRFAGKGTKLADLPIPAKHRYGAGHKIASASPYNVAQLYAMLGESIRNGKKEPCFDGAMRRHRLIDVIARASQTGQDSFWRSPMMVFFICRGSKVSPAITSTRI